MGGGCSTHYAADVVLVAPAAVSETRERAPGLQRPAEKAALVDNATSMTSPLGRQESVNQLESKLAMGIEFWRTRLLLDPTSRRLLSVVRCLVPGKYPLGYEQPH